MMEAKDNRREPLPPSRPGRNSICQEGDHTRAETERRVEWDGRTDGRTDRCRRRQRRQHFPRFKTILLTSSLEEEEIKQTRRGTVMTGHANDAIGVLSLNSEVLCMLL